MATSPKSIGYWLQIFSNIGILIGLVLVGLQMKQNSDLLRIQLLYEESDRYTNAERILMGEEPAKVLAKSLTNPTEMTLDERRIVDVYFYTTVEHWFAGYRLNVQGLIEEQDWKHRIRRDAEYIFGNAYGVAWWKVYSRVTSLPKELIDVVDAELSQIEDSNSFALQFDQLIQEELLQERQGERE